MITRPDFHNTSAKGNHRKADELALLEARRRVYVCHGRRLGSPVQ